MFPCRNAIPALGFLVLVVQCIGVGAPTAAGSQPGRFSQATSGGSLPASEVTSPFIALPAPLPRSPFRPEPSGVITPGAAASTPPAAEWEQLPPPTPFGESVIYDPIGGCIVLVGDFNSQSESEAWSLSLGSGGKWTRLHPLGRPPGGRYFA